MSARRVRSEEGEKEFVAVIFISPGVLVACGCSLPQENRRKKASAADGKGDDVLKRGGGKNVFSHGKMS